MQINKTCAHNYVKCKTPFVKCFKIGHFRAFPRASVSKRG